jgi:hypothetical protein
VETLAIGVNCLFRRFRNLLHLRSLRTTRDCLLIQAKLQDVKGEILSVLWQCQITRVSV